MLTDACNQTILWMGLRLVAPEDWQIVRHGISPYRGQLIFVDRYRQRMQVNWSACPRPPDVDHMIHDYRARLLEAQPDAQLTELTNVPRWRGVRRTVISQERDLTRAVHYDASMKRLLEAVILTEPDDPSELRLIEDVLDQLEAIEPTDAITHWRAFDLDVTMPPPPDCWRLVSTRVRPADVTLAFEQLNPNRKFKPTGARFSVHRLGMTDVWYDGDAEAFVRKATKGTRLHVESTWRQGRAATKATGIEAGARLKRILGRLRQREDLFWECPTTNAVYHLSLLTPRKSPIDVGAFTVRSLSSHVQSP